MSYLRRKTASGWEGIVQPGAWPAQVPVQITEADLVPLTITENGTYYPQAPHNGFSSVTADVAGMPSVITPGDTIIHADFTQRSTTSSSVNYATLFTVQKAGTYRIRAQGRCSSYLYATLGVYVGTTLKGNATWGTSASSFDSRYYGVVSVDLSLDVGNQVRIGISTSSGLASVCVDVATAGIDLEHGL